MARVNKITGEKEVWIPKHTRSGKTIPGRWRPYTKPGSKTETKKLKKAKENPPLPFGEDLDDDSLFADFTPKKPAKRNGSGRRRKPVHAHHSELRALVSEQLDKMYEDIAKVMLEELRDRAQVRRGPYKRRAASV